MASLYIKNPDTADLAREVAESLGTSKTAAVHDGLLHRKRELEQARALTIHERMDALRKAIGETERVAASDAYTRYGKGSHPAGLNKGDCFAYACANTNDARPLYTGNGFSKTDLA